ncbi:MAG: ABC transporter substrate-binding protein [Actinomycetota bacterium]|nr:ABC transporter substrate-binding protein [Actinomycetota bacterium]
MRAMGKLYPLGAALSALAVVSAASASGATDPGITSKQIVIGGTIPLSGAASPFQTVAKGAEAYFKYVNAKGGVNKRKVKYIYRDDGYDPARTVEATRQLVQQDKVFAIFNSLGTEQNLNVRSYLNAAKVPQLFIGSGAVTFGRDYKKYPWTMAYQPNYVAEGQIYGRQIARGKRAKIAILYQNDEFGKELIKGLKKGLGKKASWIVRQQGYDISDSNVKSQVAKLKASKANVLLIFATPTFTIRAYSESFRLGWKPRFYVAVVSSASNIMLWSTYGSSAKHVEGSVSIVFIKDPTDPRWTKSPGIRLYRSIMKKYGNPKAIKDAYNVYGMSAAFTMVDALKKAGRNPSRKSLLKAATHINERNNPFVLPGIVVRTTPTSRFPIGQAKLERWHNGRWVYFGPLQTVR